MNPTLPLSWGAKVGADFRTRLYLMDEYAKDNELGRLVASYNRLVMRLKG